MTAQGEQPTLGTLLREADMQARDLMMDVNGHDAEPVLRGWATVVQTAVQAWDALPVSAPGADQAGLIIHEIDVINRSAQKVQARQDWPGDGPTDPRIMQLTETLAQARDIARSGQPDVALDAHGAAEARMRIMHTLYVGAHAVGTIAMRHRREVLATREPSQQWRQWETKISDSLRRIEAMENLAGNYIGGRPHLPELHLSRGKPVDFGQEVGAALSRWDIQAHDAMEQSPTAATLQVIAHTQSVIAAASVVILHGGVEARQVDRDDFTGRLSPALQASHEAWRAAATTWGGLIGPGERCDLDVLQAADQTRRLLRELTFDKDGWASPETMALRVKAATVIPCVYQAAAGGADLAIVYRDTIATDPGLRGFAPVLDRVAQQLQAKREADSAGPPAAQAALVAPRDIHQRRTAQLPRIVRAAIHQRASDIVAATQRSQSAAGAPRSGHIQDPSADRLAQSQRLPQSAPAKESVAPGWAK